MKPFQSEYLRFAPMTRVLLEEEHSLAAMVPNASAGLICGSYDDLVVAPFMADDEDAAPADDEDGFGDDDEFDDDDELDDDDDLDDEFDEFDDDEFDDDEDEFDDDDDDDDDDEDEDDEDY